MGLSIGSQRIRQGSLFWRGLLGLIFLGLFGSVSVAQAGSFLPGQYFLLDHPDGAISPPPYGLRMDSLGYTFSVELNGAEVVLDWSGGTTATLTGTLWNNQTSELWSVDYEITGIVTAPANLGFTATGGNGSLVDPSLSVTSLVGKQDGSGSAFTLLADGHRLGGHPLSGGPDTPVARGWVQGSGTNDWLAVVTPIPEPGTGLLFGFGLIGLAEIRRRRGP